MNKVEIAEDEGAQQQNPFTFHSIQVLSVSGSSGEQLFGACPAMMTDVLVEGVAHVQFECDTAASHCIMSEDVYHSLQQQRWRIPQMRPEKLTVK